MRSYKTIFSNYFLFIFICLLFVSIQSSLWLHFFGYFPSPQLWILPLTYWTLYRKPFEGLTMTYIITIITAAQTATSLNILLFSFIFLFLSGFLIKRRIFWAGPTYYIVACGLTSLTFPFLHFIFSLFIDPTPISSFEFFTWMISSLLTALFALPAYTLFDWIDRFTAMELPTEAGSSGYE